MITNKEIINGGVMKIKNVKVSLLSMLLAFSLVLSACGSSKKNEEPSKPSKKTEEPAKNGEINSLANWKGVWNNFGAYLEEPAVVEAFKKLENGEKTLAETKTKNDFGFNGMEFDGNKITLFDQMKSKGGKALDSTEYEFVKAHTMKQGNREYKLYEFKAKDANAKNPVILLGEPHGEEVMLHIHFRLGKTIDEALNAKKIATFVKDSVTVEQIAKVVSTRFEKPAKKEEAKAVQLTDWKGEWNNFTGYFEKPEVQKSFEELGKKEGKSAADAKKELFEKRKTEFNGIKLDGNKVTFYDKFISEGGKEIATLEYKFVESHKVKHGGEELSWNVFETKGNDTFKYLALLPVHGEEELVHFHLRYGNDLQKILRSEDWYPTFVKPNSTMEQISHEVGE